MIKKIINGINSFHPTIKFAADQSKAKANFLDIVVALQNSVL